MENNVADRKRIDFDMARDFIRSFNGATHLGCTIADNKGGIIYELGYGCASCELCKVLGMDHSVCFHAQEYGMSGAERFGGKYIYYCPMGLTCFISPIVGPEGTLVKVIAGPALMVDYEDYIALDLADRLQIKGDALEEAARVVRNISIVPPKEINALSNLLFMSVGFMNDITFSHQLLERQRSEKIQGEINEVAYQLKSMDKRPPYPLEKEDELSYCVSHQEIERAEKVLDELLGYLIFCFGSSFSHVKSRVNRLLYLISKSAVEGGADLEHVFMLDHGFFQQLPYIRDSQEICIWIHQAMNQYMKQVLSQAEKKHKNIIFQAIRYMNDNYADRITLEDVAGHVYLSASYFSRIFREETGETFNAYLNYIRVEKSKGLLLTRRMKISEVATRVGFDDQSYFTKVFKKATGMLPGAYREAKGRRCG
ncbi:AraC family transcriptional regulator [Hominifimenecus sp. rT4P-3]|uniref:AraC family transcriptional regulator n=1 Tax=Hominifimenecus sp. rT4P-3 TaxID=3242979 RepID=UPI003DA5F4E3